MLLHSEATRPTYDETYSPPHLALYRRALCNTYSDEKITCPTASGAVVLFLFFFFQAEDGIRDHCMTGVQTCALPISSSTRLNSSHTVISYAVFCLRSEEHTSELQSYSDLVCCLLLEKKKQAT